MKDLFASDPEHDRVVRQRVEEQLAWLRERIGPQVDDWQIVSCRQKMRKLLFEVDANGQRIICKVSASDRAQQTYEILSRLRSAGLCPPSEYIVPEPIGWFPERHLLLQEKAEGEALVTIIQQDGPRAKAAARCAGQWLRCLQALGVRAESAPAVEPVLDRCRRELVSCLPPVADRVNRLVSDLELRLHDTPRGCVPSHGDFHPMNVFVNSAGAVTAIDVDTFARREPAADVGYCLAQIALMGATDAGFENTATVRAAFLEAAPAVPPERVDAHVRLAFLRSIHYDLCILRLGDKSRLPQMLDVVENGLAP